MDAWLPIGGCDVIRRLMMTLAGGLALMVALTGCAGGGSGSAERPSASLTLAPTRTAPTATRPSRTAGPTDGASPTNTAGPTSTGGPETPRTSTASPTTRPSPTPPSTTPTPTSPTPTSPSGGSTTKEPGGTGSTAPEPSASASAGQSSAAGEDSTDDGTPAWVWWLLAAVVLGAIVLGALLVARARRRRQWRERLEAAETEAAWLARELLPQLKVTGSQERVAGGWQIGVPRVAALEDELTVLEASAPTEEDGVRARALRDAVRAARARVDAIATGGPLDTWSRDVDEAIALLEAALAPAPPPGA